MPDTAPPPDVVAMTRELVAMPSVNPDLDASGAGEAGIAELTAGWLRGWGFDVELVDCAPARPSVLARLERGPGPSLILSGHLDTVGVADMEIPPFDAAIRDGRVWGRGAADMKGGVAAALGAARAAAADGVRGTLTVALTADEEAAGAGIRSLLDAGLGADAAIVCEPTGLAVMPAHKGFAWIRIEFRGQAAHGSRPERGVDAIRHAGLFLARLDEIEQELTRRPAHPLLGVGTLHAGTIVGGTSVSVYPSSCRLVLERRTLPGETVAAVRAEVEFLLARLRSDVPSLDAELEIELHREGSELPDDHELARAMLEAAGAAGIEPTLGGMTAWVEASELNRSGTPALCFGPGGIEDAHAATESVGVDDLRLAEAALCNAVRRLLS